MYQQYEIVDAEANKKAITQGLNDIKTSYVRVGYHLRQCRDENLYKVLGYNSIAEYAKENWNLNGTTVSRFIEINERFSKGGNSPVLDQKYEGFGQSKLTELLQLPDSDMEIVSPEMKREDIRSLKNFNKGAAEGNAEGFEDLVRQFLRENSEILQSIKKASSTSQKKDAVIPSGTRTYKKGLFFLMMSTEAVKHKRFMDNNVYEHTWEEFFEIAEEMEHAERSFETEPEERGNEEKTGRVEEKAEVSKEGKEVDERKTINKSTGAGATEADQPRAVPDEEKRESISSDSSQALPGSSGENSKGKEQSLADIEDPNKSGDCAGANAGVTGESAVIEDEVAADVMITRKAYMDELTAHGMAEYLAKEFRNGNLKTMLLTDPAKLQEYLEEEVDSKWGMPD